MNGKGLWIAAAALVVGACDNPTGSGDEAWMEVAAVGEDGGASRSVAPSESGTRAQQSSASGTVSFDARVYVQTSAGAWLELTDGAAESVSVDAAGQSESRAFASERVEAGSYSRVRVVFEDVDAQVNGSIQIGTGLLSGAVSVDLQGDNQVVVEREVNVTARTAATTRLLVNLNADAWLSRANAQTKTVSEAEFASAVAVMAR
ncbi:MAG TPA: hypothetical protein VF710_21430 [Longimicrobium sp.]|jgi:hypothetical protein